MCRSAHQSVVPGHEPVVEAYRKGRQLLVICPRCGAGHFHGVGGTQVGEESRREPHCLDRSFWGSSYAVRYVGDATEEYVARHRRAHEKVSRRFMQSARYR